MNSLLPIVITTIVLILIVLDLLVLTLWRKRVEYKLKRRLGWKEHVLFIQMLIGLVIVLTAALFVFDGNIMGEKTLGFA
jgi:hypothetical protein